MEREGPASAGLSAFPGQVFGYAPLVPERLGLRAVFERLLQSDEGRRAVRHLATAAEAPERSRRRTHLRTAVRLARRALL